MNNLKIRERNSNLELLRIIAMVLIIFFHSARKIVAVDSISKIFITVITMWGLLGVNLFVFISAYFMVDQKFKIKRIIDLIVRTMMYIIIMTFLYLGWSIYTTGSVGQTLFDIIEHHGSAFTDPLWTSEYWFVTAYLFMVLISPLLNCLLNKLDRNKVYYLLLFLSFIPILSNFYGYGSVIDIVNFGYKYLLIGYLKKYKPFNISTKKLVCYLCICTLIMICGRFITKLNAENSILFFIQKLTECTIGNYSRHSFILIIESLLMFNIFIRLKPFSSKTINLISSHTLGIYLFHENPFFNICDLVISKVMDIGLIQSGLLFIPIYAASILLIFICGLIFDIVYSNLLHKPVMKMITNRYGKFMTSIDHKINSLF